MKSEVKVCKHRAKPKILRDFTYLYVILPSLSDMWANLLASSLNESDQNLPLFNILNELSVVDAVLFSFFAENNMGTYLTERGELHSYCWTFDRADIIDYLPEAFKQAEIDMHIERLRFLGLIGHNMGSCMSLNTIGFHLYKNIDPSATKIILNDYYTPDPKQKRVVGIFV